jgi:hypothetical protein
MIKTKTWHKCIVFQENVDCQVPDISFKFPVKVGVEESIVNAPLVSLQNKNTNNAKSKVKFKQVIRGPLRIDSSMPTLTGKLNDHPISLIWARKDMF